MNLLNPPPLSNVQQQALNWISRLNSGDCSDAERTHFADWLAQNPAHGDAYREVEQFWTQIGEIRNVADSQLTAARQYLADARKPKKTYTWVSLAAAATLAGVLLLNPQSWLQLIADDYQTVKGERRNIQLSDGSTIELNTDTQVKVSIALGMRTVWLDRGEAWFSVKHDEQQPFEVIAAEGRIRDIGTQFNVYRQAERVTVAVQEGEVSITTRQAPQEFNLTAGQQTAYDGNGQLAAIQPSDVDNLAAWRSGQLIFNQQALRDVVAQLSRYHNVTVSITDPQLQKLSVSGRFPANDLTQTLNTMASALSVKIIWTGAEQVSIQK